MDHDDLASSGPSKRRDVLVYVALFLLVGVAMVVALWYFQHNTLRANFGPDQTP